MSTNGNCHGCASRLQAEAIEQISLHRGPHFAHWRKQMAASVGARLHDDDRLTA